jgi:putative flippase GtrA
MRKIAGVILRNEGIIQFVKFSIAGGFCMGLEYVIFVILLDHYNVNYLNANIVSLAMSIVMNYFLLKNWVFETGRYSGKMEFTAFVIVSLLGILLNQSFIWGYVELMHIEFKSSKLLAIGSVACMNFFMKKYIVFKC